MSAFALEDGIVYTPIPPMREGLTVSGACTHGSTAPRRGVTRPPSGGVDTRIRQVMKWCQAVPVGRRMFLIAPGAQELASCESADGETKAWQLRAVISQDVFAEGRTA